jgi:hypothetical protein
MQAILHHCLKYMTAQHTSASASSEPSAAGAVCVEASVVSIIAREPANAVAKVASGAAKAADSSAGEPNAAETRAAQPLLNMLQHPRQQACQQTSLQAQRKTWRDRWQA